MRTIEVTKEVDIEVDVSDYIDEILDECYNEDIIEQVYKRKLEKEFVLKNSIAFYNKNDFKRFLCDILEVDYCTDNNTLIELLKERI